MDLNNVNLLGFFADSFVVKAIDLSLVALFVIYSFVTIREVFLMNQTIRTPIRREVQLLAFLQLFLGVIVLVVILVD